MSKKTKTRIQIAFKTFIRKLDKTQIMVADEIGVNRRTVHGFSAGHAQPGLRFFLEFMWWLDQPSGGSLSKKRICHLLSTCLAMGLTTTDEIAANLMATKEEALRVINGKRIMTSTELLSLLTWLFEELDYEVETEESKE